jgi:nucleoid DNA-binding protein
VKATLEIPDAIFRRAKSKAAARGVPLRQFVDEAVVEKLKAAVSQEERPWLKHFGKLKHLRKKTKRIGKFIEGAVEKIDPEMWD